MEYSSSIIYIFSQALLAFLGRLPVYCVVCTYFRLLIVYQKFEPTHIPNDVADCINRNLVVDMYNIQLFVDSLGWLVEFIAKFLQFQLHLKNFC